MDWLLWLFMIPLAWFMWWVGFVATRRMRIEKNKEREVIFAKMAAATEAESKPSQQVKETSNN